MSRPDVSDERRPQIVEAAMRVFARKGYRKATVPDVAREAGLSVGGVYWYFKSKEEIVEAILAHLFQNDLKTLAILLNQDAPAAVRLQLFIENYLQLYKQLAWLNPVGIQFYAEAAHDLQVRGFIQQYLSHYRQALVTLVEQGIQRGEFRSINPIDAANVLLGLEEGIVLLTVADAQGVNWETTFRTGMELLLAGLAAHQSFSFEVKKET